MPLTLGNLRLTYVDTNYVLDIAYSSKNNGAKITLYAAHGGPNQLWIPEPLVTPPPPGENSPLLNNSVYLVQLFVSPNTK